MWGCAASSTDPGLLLDYGSRFPLKTGLVEVRMGTRDIGLDAELENLRARKGKREACRPLSTKSGKLRIPVRGSKTVRIPLDGP